MVVAGVEDGLIPHTSAVSPAQHAEEARLFYVAITRAVDQLVITRAETRRGVATRPSPWLEAVEATIADDTSGRAAAGADETTFRDPLAELRAWRSHVARRPASAS